MTEEQNHLNLLRAHGNHIELDTTWVVPVAPDWATSNVTITSSPLVANTFTGTSSTTWIDSGYGYFYCPYVPLQ